MKPFTLYLTDNHRTMETKKKKSIPKSKGKRHRTIAEELHKQWRKLQRNGDALAIAEKLGVSKPTIDNALAYGCVQQQRIVDGITEFFKDRLTNEANAAKELENLQTTES